MYVARDIVLELYSKPAWSKDGLCKEYPDLSWFVDRGESTTAARSVCSRCIVKAECLAWAVEHDEDGLWGGTSQKERRLLGKIASRGAG